MFVENENKNLETIEKDVYIKLKIIFKKKHVIQKSKCKNI